MFASMRQYALQSGKSSELIERIRDEFVPMIDKAPGFVAYTVVQTSADEIATTSVFKTKSGAEDSAKLAAGWVKDNVSAYAAGPPRVTTGEVHVRYVKDGAPARVGVMRRFVAKRTDVERMATRINDGLVPMMSGLAGFASFAMIMESDVDRGMTLSAYLDRASAEAAYERASAWMREHLADMLPEPVEVVMGDVRVRHLATVR